MTDHIFLLRHATSVANSKGIYEGQEDSPLSKRGISEAKQLAESLSKFKFAAIYSSDLSRSFETAKIIAKARQLEVQPMPELRERKLGIFGGLKLEKIKEKYPKIYAEHFTRPTRVKIPGGETLSELQARGLKAIDSIRSKHENQMLCIVGHSAINRCILFHYMSLSLDNYWQIRQDNLCLNIIEFSPHPIIKLLNGRLVERKVNKEIEKNSI